MAPMSALDMPSLIAAFENVGWALVKVGTVPPWMELVSESFPCGPIYRMTQPDASHPVLSLAVPE